MIPGFHLRKTLSEIKVGSEVLRRAWPRHMTILPAQDTVSVVQGAPLTGS